VSGHDREFVEFRRFASALLASPFIESAVAEHLDRFSSFGRFQEFGAGDIEPLMHAGQFEHGALSPGDHVQPGVGLDAHVVQSHRGAVAPQPIAKVKPLLHDAPLKRADSVFEREPILFERSNDELLVALLTPAEFKNRFEVEPEARHQRLPPLPPR